MNCWIDESLRESIEILANGGRKDLASDLDRILGALDIEDMEIFRHEGCENLAHEIMSCEDVTDFVDIFRRMARELEVDHCTLHVVFEAASTNFTTKVLTTYPEQWITRYIDNRYLNIDPVVRASRELSNGFYWDSIEVPNVPTVLSFLTDAMRFGIGPSGYTQPIRTERGDKIAISVSSTKGPDAFRASLARQRSDLFNLAITLSESFCRLASEDRPLTFNLTHDQIMALRAVALGETEEDLMNRTYVYGSFRTVERSINAQFQTRTLAQAAVLAARMGILDEAPLTNADVLGVPPGTSSGNQLISPDWTSAQRRARLRTLVSQAEASDHPARIIGQDDAETHPDPKP